MIQRMGDLRVVAILATYNERRFVGPCLDHLHQQGVQTYLIDNCSTDETVEIAERHLGRGLIGIDSLPREEGAFSLVVQMQRKEELVGKLEADWFIHLDADEVRLPPPGWGTLAEALAEVDRQGYNAVNFLEFTFVPTREAPDHDHPEFHRTLRTYYPFCPSHPHQLKAWKAAAAPQPDLASTGGHRVAFTGLRMHPRSFPMKHYLFLSAGHAIEKYGERRFDPAEVDRGWHGWRTQVTAGNLHLPRESELRVSRSDRDLDPSAPRRHHYVDCIGK
jgi:Glycosyl transferase family 2